MKEKIKVYLARVRNARQDMSDKDFVEASEMSMTLKNFEEAANFEEINFNNYYIRFVDENTK